MTWHDLTFTASHVLTASDMNRMHENFTALAHGDSGAPAFAVNSLMVTGVASIATLHVSSEATFASGGIPTGAVIPFAGTAAPAGWLLCAGQAVSRSTYAALFTAIGTVFGTGDGSTTFNVPDLRGRAVVALDNLGGSSANRITAAWADSLGGTGGDENLQQHLHAIQGVRPADEVGGQNDVRVNANANGTQNPGGNTDNAGTGSGGNIQPSIALGYIIKT